MKIETHHKKIPWSWAVFMGFPWVAFQLLELISQQPVTFTLRKFINDPALISFITSINILFNFSVGVTAAYLSDRIWTRWGRRRPFMMTAYFGVSILLFALPLIGSFWVLVTGLIAYQFFVDLNKPWEAMFNEVIPAPQRGRAGIFRMMFVNLGKLLFLTVLIGQFDRVYKNLETPFGILTGEIVIYWSMALLCLLTGCFFVFAVREREPVNHVGDVELERRPSRIPGVAWLTEKGETARGLKIFLKEIFADRHALWIYLLYICPWLVGIAASTESPNYTLFIVDQLGISKAELGRINLFVWPILVFAFTPLAGLMADRFSPHVMFRIGILVPALIQLTLHLYLRFFADYQASPALLIAFGLITVFFQSWLWAVWGPLIFDYIPSNKMGTYMAGITLVSGILGFVMVNLSGWWVKGFTALFGVSGKGDYDYSSIQLLWLLLAVLAFGVTFVFAWAERKGYIRPEGRLEIEEKEE